MKRYFLLLMFIHLTFISFGQEIEVRWDILSTPRINPVLVFSNLESEIFLIKGEEKSSPTLGSHLFNLSEKPGKYQLFLINPDFDDEFADWTSCNWIDYFEVLFKDSTGRVIKVQPQRGSGSVWHALDVIGENFTPIIIDQILPRSSALFGLVFDATTGLPLSQVKVVVENDSGVVARDSSSRSGLYLFFLPTGFYKLSFGPLFHAPRSFTADTQGGVFPRRFDLPLNRPLSDNHHTIVLTWENYPQDLELEILKGAEEILPAKIRSQNGFTFETADIVTEPGDEYKVRVRTGKIEDNILMGYSGATITIFSSAPEVLKITIPMGFKDGTWTAFSWQEVTGWEESTP